VNTNIGAQGARGLAVGLAESSLTHLDLNFCSLGSEGCAIIAGAVGPNLLVLNLARNDIEDDGCAELGAAIERPTCALREVNLSSNLIAIDGALALARSLGLNASLVTLDMSVNDFYPDDGRWGALVALLEANWSLEETKGFPSSESRNRRYWRQRRSAMRALASEMDPQCAHALTARIKGHLNPMLYPL
jgi:hypothetical protein